MGSKQGEYDGDDDDEARRLAIGGHWALGDFEVKAWKEAAYMCARRGKCQTRSYMHRTVYRMGENELLR